MTISDTLDQFVIDVYSALPPESIEITIADSVISIAWEPVPGATYYKVFASDTPNPEDWGDPIYESESTLYTSPIEGDRKYFRIVAGANGEN